jgi:hypothetical protein
MSALRNHRVNRRLLKGAVAAALAGLGLTACQPGAMVGQSSTGAPSGVSVQQPQPALSGTASDASYTFPVWGDTDATGGRLRDGKLRAMPSGSVTLQRDDEGQLTARIALFGLTPGSSHTVAIEAPGVTLFAPVVSFGTFTADATGQARATLTARAPGRLPAGSRFSIHLGTYGGDFNRNPVAMELLAQTDPLPARLDGDRRLLLHALSYDANGHNLGPLYGRQKITYDPAAHTLTVTVSAHGLTPGAHAAHIHLGSCQAQGGVKYMIPDFVADSRGDIVDETRTVTNVTSAPPTSGLYLNLHLGDMNSILSNGAPALGFRPMLCSDLGRIPVVSSGQPTATPSTPPVSAMPSGASQQPTAQSSPTVDWTPTTAPTGVTSPTSTPGAGVPTSTAGSGPWPSAGPSASPTQYGGHW